MKEDITHSGAWGLAAIMIGVASWVLYRYLVPKTWREWASAGVVQAFIIVLYVEISDQVLCAVTGPGRCIRHDKGDGTWDSVVSMTVR